MQNFDRDECLRAYKAFLTDRERYIQRDYIREATEFINWIEKKNINLKALNRNQLEAFVLSKAHLNKVTYGHRKLRTRKFLIWMNEQFTAEFETPEQLFPAYRYLPKAFPAIMHLYASENKPHWHWCTYRKMKLGLEMFYPWLVDEGGNFSKTNQKTIKKYIAFLKKKNLNHQTFNQRKNAVAQFLGWLYERDLISFSQKELFPTPDRNQKGRYDCELPTYATQFLSTLPVTLQPHTCMGYKNTLRCFHLFLIKNDAKINRLNRTHLELWYQSLSKDGLSSVSRIQHILHLRTYIRWLHCHEVLVTDPQFLIKNSDYPRKPKYLPRSLSCDIDLHLQKLLESSTDIRLNGLLLMRLSGMRIGELSKLKIASMSVDTDGNSFIKLPLGKLQKERVVPIDLRVVTLFNRIRAHSRNYFQSQSPYLICNRKGKPFHTSTYMRSLGQVTRQIKTTEPITSHRLRHTYATELLNAGVSLPVLMRLLGHTEITMTLRYAAASAVHVRSEYTRAIDAIERKYEIPITNIKPASQDPEAEYQSLRDIALGIKKKIHEEKPDEKKSLKLLLRKLYRLESELKKVF